MENFLGIRPLFVIRRFEILLFQHKVLQTWGLILLEHRIFETYLSYSYDSTNCTIGIGKDQFSHNPTRKLKLLKHQKYIGNAKKNFEMFTSCVSLFIATATSFFANSTYVRFSKYYVRHWILFELASKFKQRFKCHMIERKKKFRFFW